MTHEEPRILLVEPPFYRLFKETYSLDRYPLSLGYLGGTIKGETDWDVMAYNPDFSPENESIKVGYLAGEGFGNYLHNLKDLSGPVWQEIRETISEYKPTVVGISAKSQNFASARVVAGLVKEFNPRIAVIVGGPHPSMVGPDILECPHIDICVRGEGERTIVELLNALRSARELDSITGIVYKKNGEIVENAPRALIADLDSLCFPHENAAEILKDYEHYPASAFRNIFATRGCPHNCFFCGSRKIWTRKPRFRSPGNVIREIKGLQAKGVKRVHFDDDNFGVHRRYINDLCNALITQCPGLKWSCETHVKLVDEETISLMKAAGCVSIQIGIESGNNEILKEMKKGITIQEALRACAIIKKEGIHLQAFFIVGYPHETENTLNDTIEAMKQIKCDRLIYSIFMPYPGTEAFEFCRNAGLINDEYDVSLYNHQSPANCFCINIPAERFRALVSTVEEMVDRRNSLKRLKELFSSRALRQMQELGIGKGFRKGIRILLGK